MNRTRVYLPGGTVAHVLPFAGSANARSTALCSRTPWPGDWHGTGTAGEYEKAAGLPLCAGCRAKLRSLVGDAP